MSVLTSTCLYDVAVVSSDSIHAQKQLKRNTLLTTSSKPGRDYKVCMGLIFLFSFSFVETMAFSTAQSKIHHMHSLIDPDSYTKFERATWRRSKIDSLNRGIL